MELTVGNIFGLLLRSRLLPEAVAQTMFQTWKQESGADAHNVAQFAKWLVARKYLTDYQVGLLAQGYADGFYIGEYKILDRLGRGRMAGVYQAVHESGQVVAVKVLPPSKAREPNLLARFEREARLALKLNHPNVVRSFQVGASGGLHYLAMEYLEGEPVDEVLQRRGRFPPAEAARLIFQALLGLQHIHEQRLVHRDLNPGNLMLIPSPGQGDTANCTVKLLDIGLGREIFDDSTSVKEGVRLTMAGVVLGTPEFMSPEQGRDARAVDIRSDIYSLGCVLYKLIAGQSVFPDTNAISQMIRHATEEPRPLKEFNPAVPEGLQHVVSKMLAKEAGKRYETPERAAEALRACLTAGAEVSRRAEPSIEMRSFLTWLEKENKKPDTGASPELVEPPATGNVGAARVPATAASRDQRAVARAAAKAAARASARKMVESRKRSRKRLTKTHVQVPAAPAARAAAVAVGPPVAAEPPTAMVPDVQLVPVAPPLAASGLRITWRDFLMFAIGVLGSLAAIGIAYLLARFLA